MSPAPSVAAPEHIDPHHDATTAEAKRFYERAGFRESPIEAMTIMITIADVEKALAGS